MAGPETITDSADTTASGTALPHHEAVLDFDIDAALKLDPWRPLHQACDRLCLHKPLSDEAIRRVADSQMIGRFSRAR